MAAVLEEPYTSPWAKAWETALGLVSPARRHTLEKYAPGYARMWNEMTIRPERAAAVRAAARGVLEDKARYREVEAATGVPWWFVGVVHKMECNRSFEKHLHNGDSLKRRTWRVPAGRPLRGFGPFTWQESAVDALRLKGLQNVKAWTIERVCFELERFNGFGYRQYNIPSPYLWSYANHYRRGKYVRDGVWDSRAVSEQSGAVPMLAELMRLDPSISIKPGRSYEPPEAPPTNEDERLPPTPSAAKSLARSRTMFGGVVAAIGWAVGKAAEWIGDPIGTVAAVVDSADAFAAPLSRLAEITGTALPWIGAAALCYGLALVFGARIMATLKGKIG